MLEPNMEDQVKTLIGELVLTIASLRAEIATMRATWTAPKAPKTPKVDA